MCLFLLTIILTFLVICNVRCIIIPVRQNLKLKKLFSLSLCVSVPKAASMICFTSHITHLFLDDMTLTDYLKLWSKKIWSTKSFVHKNFHSYYTWIYRHMNFHSYWGNMPTLQQMSIYCWKQRPLQLLELNCSGN